MSGSMNELIQIWELSITEQAPTKKGEKGYNFDRSKMDNTQPLKQNKNLIFLVD